MISNIPKEKEEVGVKRKDREGIADVVTKKRVVETEVTDPNPSEKTTSVSEVISPLTGDTIDDIIDDYVLIKSKKVETTNSIKPKPKAMKPKTSQASSSVAPPVKEAPLLPSVTPPVQRTIAKPRKTLTVETNHEPEKTPEVSKEEKVQADPGRRQEKGSIGWFPKVLILLLGVALSSLPFVYFCTNDTLALAALGGQSSLMKVMMKMGADLELVNENGETLLLEACRLGNERAVQLFLESGSNAEAVNRDGDTPLAVALRLGNFNIANSLIEGGAKKDTKDINDDTYLIQAVWNRNYVGSKYLIEEVEASLEVKSRVGEVPLAMALRTNQLDIAKLLLDSGANVEVAIDGGETLLSRSVFYNSHEKVKLLLDAGANVESIGKDGATKPLLQAVMNGDEAIVKMLLAKNANTEARNHLHWTPLLVSAEQGRVEILRLLLAAGADVNAVTKADGKTSLMWAILKGHDQIATALVEAGADVSIMSKAGNNALAVAQQYGRGNVEQILKLIPNVVQ